MIISLFKVHPKGGSTPFVQIKLSSPQGLSLPNFIQFGPAVLHKNKI
jgi:hypothetical protein